MKNKQIKVVSLLLVLIIMFCSSLVTANAISYPNDIKTESESILLVNMDSGQTVYEKNADEKRYPASTTKIMTYIIVVENIDDLDNTRVPIKESVLKLLDGTGSSLANLEQHVGETMSVIDLLYSMMVPSGNDASVVLADYVGNGDIDAFVDMMNEKAKELGCKNTHFENPEGLHDENHYTTARDLYKITSYALTLPRFSEITDTTVYYCEGDEYPLVTTNYLINPNYPEYYYTYANGIKTGSTDQAGRCLVTTATADGYSYIAVLLHSPYKEGVSEEYGTMTDAASLFRWALTELEFETVATSSTPICEQKVELVWGKDSVLLVPQKDFSAIVPKNLEEDEIVIETDVPESVDAPLDKDTVVGTATIYYKCEDGKKQEITKVNLVPNEEIEMSGVLFTLRVIGTVFQSYWFLVIIGIIVIILICSVIASKISKRRRKNNRQVKRYRNF